jgi:hypothetical protein
MKNIDKRLDNIFAIWIKLKYTNDNGFGNCYTCDEPVTYQTGQCGHYPLIPRGDWRFRWDTIIHKLQCQDCNEFKAGQPDIFRDRLIQEIDLVNVAKYEFLAKQNHNWCNHEKEQLFKKLKKECQEMLKDKMFSINLP